MVTTNIQRGVAAVVVTAVALASASCGEVARTGRSPAFLVIQSLEAASGAEPDKFGTTLFSDVETLVETDIGGKKVKVPTIFSDVGRVTFRLGLKNPGLPTGSLAASDLNSITINRYHVVFRRADGRNTQGVDVPYAFDGAFTITVSGDSTSSGGFDLVRHQAKAEPPLRNLVAAGGAFQISTIAEITFYGRDLAGNEVMAVATMSVNFGDFGDPE